MLVLSRRPQQSLIIGNDVVITVLEVNGDTVRIGISAPSDVQIHREEVYRDLQESNRAAVARPGSAADLAKRLQGRAKENGADNGAPNATTAAPGTPADSAAEADSAGAAPANPAD